MRGINTTVQRAHVSDGLGYLAASECKKVSRVMNERMTASLLRPRVIIRRTRCGQYFSLIVFLEKAPRNAPKKVS